MPCRSRHSHAAIAEQAAGVSAAGCMQHASLFSSNSIMPCLSTSACRQLFAVWTCTCCKLLLQTYRRVTWPLPSYAGRESHRLCNTCAMTPQCTGRARQAAQVQLWQQARAPQLQRRSCTQRPLPASSAERGFGQEGRETAHGPCMQAQHPTIRLRCPS